MKPEKAEEDNQALPSFLARVYWNLLKVEEYRRDVRGCWWL